VGHQASPPPGGGKRPSWDGKGKGGNTHRQSSVRLSIILPNRLLYISLSLLSLPSIVPPLLNDLPVILRFCYLSFYYSSFYHPSHYYPSFYNVSPIISHYTSLFLTHPTIYLPLRYYPYCGEPVISLHSHTVSLVQWVNPLHPVMRGPGSIPRGVLLGNRDSPVSVVSLHW
jgi:hypothetical protein